MHASSQQPDPESRPPLPSGATLRERDDRLAALKQLVGHIAHDFNNCMVPLVGYVTLLKEEPKVGTRVDQYLAKLETSVRKTESFLETILAATYPERQYAPKQVDFTALIEKTLASSRSALTRTRPLSVEVTLVPCTLWLDEAQWSNALQHLFKNAFLAMSKVDGLLKVTLEKSELSAAEAADFGIRPGNVVQLTIEDNGEGMSEDVLKRSYDPFFTTRTDSRSDGLGLTYVHSVVRLHGGQLAIASAEGAGTRVRIWLADESGPGQA